MEVEIAPAFGTDLRLHQIDARRPRQGYTINKRRAGVLGRLSIGLEKKEGKLVVRLWGHVQIPRYSTAASFLFPCVWCFFFSFFPLPGWWLSPLSVLTDKKQEL